MAKVVRLASSPAFGMASSTDLRQAAMRVGVNGLRDLAFAVSMGRVFRSDQLEGLVKRQLVHSVVVGGVTSTILRLAGEPVTEGFMAGLFHDVGYLALLTSLPSYAQGNEQLNSPEFAQTLGDLLHADLGDRILESWGVPDSVRGVARHHHGSCDGSLLCAAVELADMADNLRESPPEERIDGLFQHTLAHELPFTYETLERVVEEVNAAYADGLISELAA